MTPARTPEGEPHFCPVCGKPCQVEPSLLTRDAVCPRCGCLLWFGRETQGAAAPSRNQIPQLVEEIARLSEMRLAPAAYYPEFLQRVLTIIAAPAGAIWLRTSLGTIELECQVNLERLSVGRMGVARAAHDKLLEEAVNQGCPGLIPPRSSMGEGGPGNPTDFVILVAPIMVEKQCEGLVEIWQDPNRGPEMQRGFLQFLVRMAAIASGFARKAAGRE